MRPVDIGFLDTAPLRITRAGRVDAPADRVFDLIGPAPARWGDWVPGFSHDGRWLTPGPPSVGGRREVHAMGTRFVESVIGYEQGRRFAFRIDEADRMPGVRAFAEDYVLTPIGERACSLTWTMALDGVVPARILRPALGPGLGVMLRRMCSRLAAAAR